MPLQNRVTPLGDLVADPARGLVYGNRGCLHDAEGRIRRRYQVRRWIACRLAFRGRRRSPLVQPGRFTELFFLDDATALAAGHRPCAECRREDYDHFNAVWDDLHGERGADAIDARLHPERIHPATRAHRLHEAAAGDLPDGAFVLHGGAPKLVLGDALLEWSPGGYVARERRPRRRATLVTPPSLVAVLRAGWRPACVPFLHPSAADALGGSRGQASDRGRAPGSRRRPREPSAPVAASGTTPPWPPPGKRASRCGSPASPGPGRRRSGTPSRRSSRSVGCTSRSWTATSCGRTSRRGSATRTRTATRTSSGSAGSRRASRATERRSSSPRSRRTTRRASGCARSSRSTARSSRCG